LDGFPYPRPITKNEHVQVRNRMLKMLTNSLKDIKVVDFSHVVAGPVCGMLLGDMGADVIKVEPLDGELGRAIGPPWQQRQSVTSLSVNRN
jgi:crotonobetainyl-CoA:carnitine CoA-transferase CaiB-like acyl-CoA transferase